MSTANDMRNCGEDIPNIKIVEKILRSLTDKLNFIVCSIEESKDIDQLIVDELQASLLVHEQKMMDKRSEEQVLQVENVPRYGQGRGRGTFQRERGYSRGRERGRSFVNLSAINYFQCGKQEHYQFECPGLEKEAINYAEFDKEEERLLMAYTKESKVEREVIWFLDSRCSNHMTWDKTWFVELDESFKHTVRLGNSSKLAVEGRGSVRFKVKGITKTVTNVYYVLNLTNNLLSIGQLQEKRLVILIKEETCRIYHQQRGQRGLIMNTKMTANRMFSVHAKMKSLVDQCLKIQDEDLEALWHKRYEHLNSKSIQIMPQKQILKELPKLKEVVKVFTECNVGKQQRKKFPKKSKWRASNKLELINGDFCGPSLQPLTVVKGTYWYL
ncbi:uncharacterized protein LOC111488339 [Cucurbita maxima]|uniref:Uncharacterized protein LOC111488339 n=1 Tax=Cucurbita maxima TaxID=3661 RepID=A0A6J1JTY9_CUCMA|nr:uncharacterized protein LOC111488339 [Cucurbita maxima]